MENAANKDSSALYAGFQALLANEFPKTCASCGRSYGSLEIFLSATNQVQQGTGLMQYEESEATPRVAVCRNCVCGSTLATFCQDRRDLSEAGRRRRERFKQLLDLFKSRGVREDVARAELITFLRGDGTHS
jgi:hypothetical protein